MANIPNTASIGTANPNYTDDKSSVTKSVSKQGVNDTVTVSASEDGTNAGKTVVVLLVNSDGKSTVSVDAKNVVQLTASGSGTNMYITINMSASDPNNWTVNVNTTGGSTYTFKKGNGGGGH
ncbi:MAG: hypothetical protein IPG69_11320 [Flavobacteriales bacterium]|nr:hypothetical protein [Flavobacteriales bacterium]